MHRILVRPERPEDIDVIHRLNVAAFGQPDEAEMVDRLRARADFFLSLVAERENRVAGHILFTPVTLEGRAEQPPAAGLAPMAVLPEHQRAGLGSALVERGFDACREAGFRAVIVLGHAEYYPRFGFQPASRWGLRFSAAVPEEVFMAIELEDGALAGGEAVVRYPPEFGV